MKATDGVCRRLFFTQLTCLLFFFTCRFVSGIPDSNIQRLSLGSSLTPQRNTTCLVSRNGTFSAGFHEVGDNAYAFAIWYTHTRDGTVAWVANREQPVNGRDSSLSLEKDGNLVLRDANGSAVWSTNTGNMNVKDAVLLETGNLVLRNSSGRGHFVWESFHSPTDTILPLQHLNNNSPRLISRLGSSTFKQGHYILHFNSDNILQLMYQGYGISSNYWPDPSLRIFENGRGPYDSNCEARLDSFGRFHSSDGFSFNASDYGKGPKRRLTLDFDGNLRLYSLVERTGLWDSTWMAIPNQCYVHGFCGINGLCIYTPKPSCICPPGFHRKNSADWFQGCEHNRQLTASSTAKLIYLPHTDYYGYDLSYCGESITFKECKDSCMNDSTCNGFAYRMDGIGTCFPKYVLFNGYRSPGQQNHMYIKVSSDDSSVSNSTSVLRQSPPLNCSALSPMVSATAYYKNHKTRSANVKYPVGFAIAFGVAELVCAIFGWRHLLIAFRDSGYESLGRYSAIPGGFKKFSFSELKKATDNFKIKLGKGGFGTVYKGVLPDGEVIAVKQLEGLSQGHDQFWAEVSMIGKVHHMNLVRMFGFCAERKHRLLVYEYVENGSLDKYLFTENNDRVLGWKERFGIAVGTGKGLAYLHEECLEWILHCDIKPQNILLDNKFCPKVSDFGLAKLVDRDRTLSFSTIRGTRGYLAPEWTVNLPITAKVDVYSFGIVLLELVTGRSSLCSSTVQNCGHLMQWVSAMMRKGTGIEEVVDPKLHGNFDSEEVERVLKTALLCVRYEKDARPSMSEAVEMLSKPDFFTTTNFILPSADFSSTEEGASSSSSSTIES